MMKRFHLLLLRARMRLLALRLDWAVYREGRVLVLAAREDELHRQQLATLQIEAQRAAKRVGELARRVVGLADRMRGAQ